MRRDRSTAALGMCAAGVVAGGMFGLSRIEPRVRHGVRGGVERAVGLCFAPGASEEERAAAYARVAQSVSRYYIAGRWPGAPQTATSLTYSFPPDGIDLSAYAGAGVNVLHQTLNQQFEYFGGHGMWRHQFELAFQRWGQITGNLYREVPDDGAPWFYSEGLATGGSGRGDIRIVMGDLGVPLLAVNYYPDTGDMILNKQYDWASGAPTFMFMQNVVMHEHGHGLGLTHSCPAVQTKLMEPFVAYAFTGPQLDDIRGAQSLYGDRFEPKAVQLDPLGFEPNIPFVLGEVSLHGPSDQDFYLFSAPRPSRIRVVVTPIGAMYPNARQQPDGSCPTGPIVDALGAQDIAIDLLSPMGQVLLTADAHGPGNTESIIDFYPPVPGVYRALVRSAGGSDAPQMYEISVLVEDSARPTDLNFDGVVGASDLAIMLASWGACPGPSQPCPADLNHDGVVGPSDLASLLGGWGD